MARTQGATDAKPRKKATKKKASVKQVRKTTAPGRKAPSSTDELSAAIEQELNGGGTGQTPLGGAAPGTTGSPYPPGSAPALMESQTVGLDGWNAMLMTPFRMLSIWFAVPAVEQIGAARCGDLASASYPIYTHYMRAWLESDPDDPLAVAKVTTLAVLVGVSFEVYQAISYEMAKRREAAKNEHQETNLP